MLLVCRRTPLIENTSGKLLLYIVLNIEVINVEVLSKQVKNFLKYISVIKTLFLTLYVSFTWWPKISFQMTMWLLKNTKKGVYIRLWYLSCNLKGRLSGRMTKQFLNVLELFSPYKRKPTNLRFRSIFIFNKKEPQS